MAEENAQSRAGRKHAEEPEKLPLPIGKNYLLVIGIDEYANGIPDLRNAVKDAVAFKNTLVDQYQFIDDEPYTICLFNSAATRRRIIQVFDQLIKTIKPEDSLVFYFSGHGEIIERRRNIKGFWIPSDAELGERSTYLDNQQVLDLIESIEARHVFGIVDSCFSGALFNRSRSLTSVTERIISLPSRWLMTSGQLEVVSDGSLGENSPFAQRLLVQLRNNIEEALWVTELCHGVMKGFQFNPEKQVPEYAPLNNVGHEGGQFVFLRKNASWMDIIEQERAYRKANPPEAKPNRTIEARPADQNTPVVGQTLPPPDFSSLDGFKESLILRVGMDEIPEVFNLLYSRLKKANHRSLLLTRYSEYSKNKKDENAGIADDRYLRISYNQIRNVFSTLINNLTEDDVDLNQ